MAIQADVEGLAAIPLIALCEREAIRIIAFSSEQRSLRAGETLFRRGDALPGAVIVLDGAILLNGVPGGQGAPDILKAGSIYGESALVIDATTPGDLVAREPSEVLIVQRKLFRRVLSEFPRTAVAVRDAFALRLRRTTAELTRVGDRLRAIDAEGA